MLSGEGESEPRDMEIGSAGWVRVERRVRRQAKILEVNGQEKGKRSTIGWIKSDPNPVYLVIDEKFKFIWF